MPSIFGILALIKNCYFILFYIGFKKSYSCRLSLLSSDKYLVFLLIELSILLYVSFILWQEELF